MKNFVICLPDYVKSVAMTNQVVESGKQYGWNIELFEGVDGTVTKLKDVDLSINQHNAKCRDMMTLPGVRGCFISHWRLWNLCSKLNEPIGIFEHDIEFLTGPPNIEFKHVLKLEGFLLKKSRPAGAWYEGARAYILHPLGAKLLINWVQEHGALPADVNIGLNVVDIQLDHSNCIKQHALYGKSDKRENSFTWNLNKMEKI